MSLTAGATLQNGKYLIQTVLPQGNVGLCYRATHTSLNQPVVIQTLNPGLRQSPQFDRLHQQFLAAVRQGKAGAAIVRDCFEEDGLPYVVLEPSPTPPQISDWMPFLQSATAATATAVTTPAATTPTATNGATAVVTSTEAIAAPQTTSAKETVPTPQLPVLPPPAIAPTAAAPAAPHPQSASRRRRWLPIALLLTACGAGLSGAALAWKLRHTATTSDSPALFSREQSFPEKTDWLGEDPYADDSYSDREDYDNDYSDSASPAIERRSVTPRRQRSATPEPDYEPRPRSRRVERPDLTPPDLPTDLPPQAEEKPLVEAPPKVDVIPDPVPQAEAPEAPVPAAPEAPAELASPKERFAPVVPAPADAEPISQ